MTLPPAEMIVQVLWHCISMSSGKNCKDSCYNSSLFVLVKFSLNIWVNLFFFFFILLMPNADKSQTSESEFPSSWHANASFLCFLKKWNWTVMMWVKGWICNFFFLQGNNSINRNHISRCWWFIFRKVNSFECHWYLSRIILKGHSNNVTHFYWAC